MGNAIIFIWEPNFKVLPAPHRTLGSTHRWRAQLSRRNEPRCGSGVVTHFQTVL